MIKVAKPGKKFAAVGMFTKIIETIRTFFAGALENYDYGNIYILNEYAGVKRGWKILGRLQHGWSPNDYVSSTYYLNNYSDTYAWASRSEVWASSKGWKNFISIGAPWLYFLEIMSGQGWESSNLRSIDKSISELWVYSYHSNFRGQWSKDVLESFLDSALASESPNKVVLLYYLDYLDFLELENSKYSGLKIVTLGERRKTASADVHIFRLFDLLSHTRKVFLETPSTIMLYALSLGCEVSWLRTEIYERELSVLVQAENFELVRLMESACVRPELNLDYTLKELGHERMKSKEELRILFHWQNNVTYYLHRILSPLKSLLLIFPRIMKKSFG